MHTKKVQQNMEKQIFSIFRTLRRIFGPFLGPQDVANFRKYFLQIHIKNLQEGHSRVQLSHGALGGDQVRRQGVQYCQYCH